MLSSWTAQLPSYLFSAGQKPKTYQPNSYVLDQLHSTWRIMIVRPSHRTVIYFITWYVGMLDQHGLSKVIQYKELLNVQRLEMSNKSRATEHVGWRRIYNGLDIFVFICRFKEGLKKFVRVRIHVSTERPSRPTSFVFLKNIFILK